MRCCFCFCATGINDDHPTSENGKLAAFASGRPAFREHAKHAEGSDTTPIRNAPCFAVWALVCDPSLKAECVPAFTRESERGAFVPEVLKAVRTMYWKRWYDRVSCTFHGFSEDEKESRINGWRLNSRKRRCPKDFGGALWLFRKEIEVITSLKIGSAGQACFESPQSMKRDFRPFKNRTAVTKEERLRQRKNCAAIGKDKAAWSKRK